MKPMSRIAAENPGCQVFSTHFFLTIVKNNPLKYNRETGYGVFHNGEQMVPISVWREDILIENPQYEMYPYVLWYDKE